MRPLDAARWQFFRTRFMHVASVLPGANLFSKILLTPHWAAIIKAWLIFDVRPVCGTFTALFPR
ncbi:protein of unknown function [Paraburkholderia kururiensis]